MIQEMGNPQEVCNQLVTAILEANRKTASSLLETWAEHHGFDQTLSAILEPALERIGHMWEQTGEVSLAQGYVAGKISEAFLLNEVERHKNADFIKGIAVIGNIEDDYHALGRTLVGTFLTLSGWKVHDLGNDVPASEFVETALQCGAKIIGASAMMYSTAKNITKLREEIDKRNLTRHIRLAVGGAVFKLRPELVHEVGGDGTASNAIKAPVLFDQLLHELSEKEDPK